MSKDTQVGLNIYNINGQLIQQLVKPQLQSTGVYEYTYEPETNTGNVFFAVLITPEQVISKKMIFIK